MAIGALRKQLGAKRYETLTAALSVFMGIEGAVVLRDVCLLSKDKAAEVKLWGANALLRAALAEAPGRVRPPGESASSAFTPKRPTRRRLRRRNS
jgi:hypothetical protein